MHIQQTMTDTKLTKQQELLIRLLDYGTNSSMLPDDLFTETNKEELLSLNLIIKIGENDYSITQKAKTIIETGGFIIKYPLADDKGNVSNYNDTLKNMSETALRALGLSIINTETIKR